MLEKPLLRISSSEEKESAKLLFFRVYIAKNVLRYIDKKLVSTCIKGHFRTYSINSKTVAAKLNYNEILTHYGQ